MTGARRRAAGTDAAGVLGRSLGIAAAAGALLAAAACTEDALVGPGPEGSRGAETVEVVLGPEEMTVWRDTTYSGYALPVDANHLSVVEEEGFRARSLLRYRTVPESVTVDSETRPVAEYTAATLVLQADTAASSLPSAGATLRLSGLRTDWQPEEVSWTRAAEGLPWETPGGDLGRELGELDLGGVADSALAEGMEMSLSPEAVDSLLADWGRNEGGSGAALRFEEEGSGARLRIRTARLEMVVRPADMDTTVAVQVTPILSADPSTFIHDPPLPGAPEGLRLGGMPAHRFYFSFEPPDSAEGVPLRQGTVNRAELVFRPRPAPDAPFALGVPSAVSLIELVADPLEEGPRTPLAGGLGQRTIRPDSLAAGRPLRFAFTGLMSRWAASPDSFGTFHLGVRMDPDAQDLGFWEFGGTGAPAALQPSVRLLITPATTFDLP